MKSRQKARLVFDDTQDRTDRYGRTLAYAQIRGVDDFGHLMLERGHAREYTYDAAYTCQDSYRHAEKTARSHQRGLWSHCR